MTGEFDDMAGAADVADRFRLETTDERAVLSSDMLNTEGLASADLEAHTPLAKACLESIVDDGVDVCQEESFMMCAKNF